MVFDTKVGFTGQSVFGSKFVKYYKEPVECLHLVNFTLKLSNMNAITLLIMSLLLTITPAAIAQSGINFETGTWEQVQQKAASQGKPIFVDAYAVWCGPCKWMDANVFTDPSVGQFFNENFINYRYDMEKGDGKQFAQEQKVTNYPTLLFFNAEGKLTHRAIGSRQVQQFIELGQEALGKM